MPKIIRANMVGEDTIDVQLDNGHTVLLDCLVLLKRPGFATLMDGSRIYHPQTDGGRLFWKDGQSMTVDEILSFVAEENKNETEE